MLDCVCIRASEAMARRRDPIDRVPRVGRGREHVGISGCWPHALPPVGPDQSGPYAHSVQNDETHPINMLDLNLWLDALK